MDALYGVNQVFLPESDDGVSGALSAGGSDGFPFGGSVQTQLYVRAQSTFTHTYTHIHTATQIYIIVIFTDWNKWTPLIW